MSGELWVSYTSMSDFLRCPRAYFLKNLYRDPKTGHKIQLMTPALALGQAVHEVLDRVSEMKVEERFNTPLSQLFEEVWKDVAGKRGGFLSDEEENAYKNRGRDMLGRIMKHPGPIKNLAIKIRMPKGKIKIPHFALSDADGIVLCGKIDWLEYLPKTRSVHIIDFKTGKVKEDADSLQLPIYHLLVVHCQKWTVTKASYWYLDIQDELTEKELPDLESARERVLAVALKMKLARTFEKFTCARDGCSACRPYEAILQHEAELVGIDEKFDRPRDIYMLKSLEAGSLDEQSELL